MIKLLKKAIEREQSYIKLVARERNPQVVEMRTKAEGRVEGLMAALDAARGDTWLLRTLAIPLSEN